jgi:hypothetical protein
MNADTVRTCAAVISVVFSLVAIGVSLYTYAKNKKKDVIPVLIFSRRSATNWQIENVGKGPALNVIVGDGKDDGTWPTIAKLYPIAAGGKADLAWLQHALKLGAKYTNIWGEKYSTTCEHDVNKFSQNYLFSETAINRREWELQQPTPSVRG